MIDRRTRVVPQANHPASRVNPSGGKREPRIAIDRLDKSRSLCPDVTRAYDHVFGDLTLQAQAVMIRVGRTEVRADVRTRKLQRVSNDGRGIAQPSERVADPDTP